ncbi:DoxX family protein [Actinomycetospora sp. C-140]
MTTRIYWISTAITVLVLLSGGLADLLGADWAVAGIAALGYPAYLAAILGVWKLLGAVAITVPGYPRLKEWAYAGVVFDLSGAAVSHLVVGSPVFHPVVTTTLAVVAGFSWATRPASRRLAAPTSPERALVSA